MKPGLASDGGFAVLIVVVVVISISSCCWGQPLQCLPGTVTVFPNGSADFSSLPAGAQDIDPVYDPGPIGGWYDLAGGFVDAVRPGSLPYDQIREALSANGLPCSLFPNGTGCNNEAQDQSASLDVQGTIQSFATWWVGILVVTIIGAVLAFAFCISGLCFCCCRCCGNCGGKKTQEIGENTDCKTFTFTIILLLLLAVLFAGVVLAFFSNQQTFDSVGNTQTTINQVVSQGTTFISDTIDELQLLVCQFAASDGIAGNVIQEARDFNSTLQNFIDGVESQVDDIGQTITTVSPGFNATLLVLSNLTNITSDLMNSGNSLIQSLNSISNTLTNIQTMCDATNNTDIADRCRGVTGSSLQAGADFTQLPDVQQPLRDVQQAIDDINFDNLVSEGRTTFDNIRRDIDQGISNNLDEGLQQVDSYNSTLFDIVNNLTRTVEQYTEDSIVADQCPPLLEVFSNVQLNVGYFRECVINGAFREIEQYDVYRYAFGVVICCLALVTVVVGLLGILMGMLGFRKNRDPDQRTKLSHCGGVFLILGTVLTFIFGFVLLVLCCIFFFFGANVQKLCQSVAYPEYPLFVELIDNTQFWGGSLLGRALPVDPNNPNSSNPQLFISEALKECRQNTALFRAANLNLLLPTGSIAEEINSRINLNEIRRSLNESLVNATQDFNDFNSTSFLPSSVQTSLEEFRNSSVDQINITAFREQINAPLLNFDINQEIMRTMDLSAQLAGLMPTGDSMVDASIRSIVMSVDNVTGELQAINTTIPMIQGQVNQLEAEVDELVGLTDTVVMETILLVDEIAAVIDDIVGENLTNFLDTEVVAALDQVFGLLESSISHADEQLSNNVAGCFPLWSIYTQMYNTACQDFIEGLNGFWWSLGFCALLFVPVIVFSVITSNFYLKKKSEIEGEYDGYRDMPMKSY